MLEHPSRPVLRYHGGKWRLAPWIIAHFPPHRVYVEPFGGSAAVLLRKPRVTTEIYNDLDGDVVNVFRQIRENPEQLARLLALTPYARDEYSVLFEPATDPLERARRWIARSFIGQNSKGAFELSGFDTRMNEDHFVSRLNSLAAMPDVIAQAAGRLTSVVIENTDGLELMRRVDRPEALFYVDPPYVRSTRSTNTYRHDMDDGAHRDLAHAVREFSACVVVSGYPSTLYDELFQGWHRVETEALTDGARHRTERLWLNPACVAALGHGPLFDGAAA